MTLVSLAGIRATKRNVNQPFSLLDVRIRRWELHHKNRLVALCRKICVRRPNSLILNCQCRVWCEVDGFIISVFLLCSILDLEAETVPESKYLNGASVHIGVEGCLYESHGFLNSGWVDVLPTFWLEYSWEHRFSHPYKTCWSSARRRWPNLYKQTPRRVL